MQKTANEVQCFTTAVNQLFEFNFEFVLAAADVSFV